ncbi:MAG: ABC transporter permease [Saprospiraceae bacterium]|nr:ABC transporter permease [Saprospiraceae bacterium]
MFKNYLKTAIRNILKDKAYAFINISGLAVGIAVCLLMVLYIHHELSYDRFHSKAERVHRMALDLKMEGQEIHFNATYPLLAETMKAEIPEVEKATRLLDRDAQIVKREDQVFQEDNIYFADPDFFDLFDFKLIEGNPQTALSAPNQVLLTPALAEKYFGKNAQNIVGSTISIGDSICTVSGIIEAAPANSHFHYNAIVSMKGTWFDNDKTWESFNVSTYVLLALQANMETVLAKVPALLQKHHPFLEEQKKSGVDVTFSSQPLTRIHLHSDLDGDFEPNSSNVYVYSMMIIAIVILLLACVNYVNLSTALSVKRIREVGIRKTLGSTRSSLVLQFGIEAVVLTVVATIFATALVMLVRQSFNQLVGNNISMNLLTNPLGILAIVVFSVFLGMAAGSYPAFFLSKFKPTEAFAGKSSAGGLKTGILRSAMVIGQFVASIALITCTIIIWQQIDYIRSKELGFDKENVVIIENANKLASMEAFKNSVKQNMDILEVGAARWKPVGEDFDGTGLESEEKRGNTQIVSIMQIDEDYIPALNLKIKEGRNFSKEFTTDAQSLLLNEEAVRRFGLSDPVGKRLYYPGDSTGFMIVGVVGDFNYQSLKNEISPLVFFSQDMQRCRNFIVKIKGDDIRRTISFLENTWNAQQAGVPFAYSFLDETYDALFKTEVRTGQIFSVFAILAIFIACMGLLGLAAYAVERRTKEIGIRKVMGASGSQIVELLSKDFLKYVVIGAVLAFPIAWYAMNTWLQGFAYRINMQWWMFVVAGVLALVIALVTVSFQAIRAAFANPVRSLRTE